MITLDKNNIGLFVLYAKFKFRELNDEEFDDFLHRLAKEKFGK